MLSSSALDRARKYSPPVISAIPRRVGSSRSSPGLKPNRPGQHPAFRGPLAQALDRQADGVADRGVLAGDADLRLVQPDPHGVPVEGQRRLQVGLAAEQDQADAVATTVFDEVAEEFLDQFQAADLVVLPAHVAVVHGAGDIHREQQVTAAGG